MYSLGLIFTALSICCTVGEIRFQEDFPPLATYEHRSSNGFYGTIFGTYPPLVFWPNGDIPYTLDHRYSAKQRESVLDAMKKIEAVSCVSFRPASPRDSSHLAIRLANSGSGCNYTYNASLAFGTIMFIDPIITLEERCFSENVIIHELLHALGMPHQHEVANRDDYITILWDNIREDAKVQFDKMPTLSQAEKDVGYDYESITHYSPYSGAIYPWIPTITPKNFSVNLKENTEMSSKDIQKLNIMYNC